MEMRVAVAVWPVGVKSSTGSPCLRRRTSRAWWAWSGGSEMRPRMRVGTRSRRGIVLEDSDFTGGTPVPTSVRRGGVREVVDPERDEVACDSEVEDAEAVEGCAGFAVAVLEVEVGGLVVEGDGDAAFAVVGFGGVVEGPAVNLAVGADDRAVVGDDALAVGCAVGGAEVVADPAGAFDEDGE